MYVRVLVVLSKDVLMMEVALGEGYEREETVHQAVLSH